MLISCVYAKYQISIEWKLIKLKSINASQHGKYNIF